MNPVDQLSQQLEQNRLWEKEITLKRNEFLKVKGSIDTNIYYVVSGSLRIFVMDGAEEQIIRFGYQNNIIAALDSFINEEPSDFYIQAIKQTSLKSVSKKTYLDFIASSPQNIKIWNQILEMMLLSQLDRERDILISSPVERYQRVLARSPHLFQEIPNKYIANYLRMTPETLSRIKKS